MNLETWKAIPGFPSYEVSDFGRVRRIVASHQTVAGYILKLIPQGGYLHAALYEPFQRRLARVHLLVLLAFKEPRPLGMVGRHLDGNRLNNKLNNLEYGTYKQNTQDTFLHETVYRGAPNRAKLTADQVIQIRNLRGTGTTLKELAIQFRVKESAIRDIVRRLSWRHI